MKKTLLGITLLFLSSCSLMGNKTPTTFDEYYARNIGSIIDSTEHTLRSLDFFSSTETRGVFDTLVSIPILFSGSLMTEYNLQSDGDNAAFTFNDAIFQYDSLAGTGFLSFDTLGLISESGNFHMLYENLRNLGISTQEMDAVFQKFDGKWLSWTQEDVRADTIDLAEIQAIDMIDNISKFDKQKIEKYLIDTPLLKSTQDIGMSGSLYFYQVEIDREAIFSLMSSLKRDITGIAFTSQEEEAIKSQIALINIAGTMGFDPDNTDHFEMSLSLLGQENNVLTTFSTRTESHKTYIHMTSVEDAIELEYTHTDGNERDDMVFLASQSGVEMARIIGYIDAHDKKGYELSLDIIIQGVSLTFKHTLREDGKFDGRILLPVGSISWNGAIDNKKLIDLQLLGASPMGAMDLDLTASGDMVQGPLVLRIGEEELMRANVGVITESQRVRFTIDIPQGTGTTDMIHGAIGLTFDHSSFRDKIKKPSSSQSLNDLLRELEMIAPEVFMESPEVFSEDVEMDLGDL